MIAKGTKLQHLLMNIVIFGVSERMLRVVALKERKLNIFSIIDRRISFYF